MARFKTVLLFTILVFASAAASDANDIYVAQSAVGANSGADCSNAKAYTFFNAAANWGAGSVLIGPGTTVHICGAITGASGATIFTFQGSGTSGNPITLKWETGAVVQAPYMSTNGGILAGGRSYIVLDGGTNGVLRNTLNGSAGAGCPGGPCTSQQDTIGLNIVNGTNVTVQNLEVGPIYYRVNTESTSGAGNCIYLNNQSHLGLSNFLVQNSKLHDCGNAIFDYYGASDGGITVSGTEIYRVNGGLKPGQGPGSGSLNGLYFHDNNVHDWDNWDDENIGYHNHHDSIQIYGGTGLTNCFVWNNYFHGSFGFGTTPGVYLDNTGTGNYTCTLFNNLVNITSSGMGGDGAFTPQNEGGHPVTLNAYNNTLIGANVGLTGFWFSGSGVTGDIRNNIVSGWNFGLYITNGANLPTISNNNSWSQAGGALFANGSANYSTVSAWTTATGKDANSSGANPNLDSNFKPLSGSPVIGLGQNLSSLCAGDLAPLCRDKSGNVRPATGAWDAGVYNFATATTSACDVNKDNTTNIVDVQQCVNQSLGVTTCTADINKDGICNVVDVQRVVNAALGGQCVTQ